MRPRVERDTTRRRRRWVLLLAAVALLATSCASVESGSTQVSGGDDDDADSGRAAVRRTPRLRPRGRDHQRLVPPRGPARHLRHPGGPLDLRHADRPERRRRVRPVPGRVGRAQRRLHRVDDHAPRRRHVPRRHAARPPRSSRTTSTPTGASTRAGPRCCSRSCWPTSRPSTSSTRSTVHGHDQGAVGGLPGVPVLERPPRDHGPVAARRRRRLRHRAHRHRPVQAREWQPSTTSCRARAQRGLLADRRRRQASYPYLDGIEFRSGHRATAAHQRPQSRARSTPSTPRRRAAIDEKRARPARGRQVNMAGVGRRRRGRRSLMPNATKPPFDEPDAPGRPSP